jgi:hypothetical protein
MTAAVSRSRHFRTSAEKKPPDFLKKPGRIADRVM